jgi:hypothetical protein
MKRLFYAAMFCLMFSAHAHAFAEIRTVRIDAFSDGRGIDSAALQEARQIIGSAVADGTVDTFIVLSPRSGGPIPIEGGLSACAEQGFGADPVNFDSFLDRLISISPQPGTTFNVEVVNSCLQEEQS